MGQPRPRKSQESYTVRYAYAVTAAMLLGGAAATVVTQSPLGAQVA